MIQLIITIVFLFIASVTDLKFNKVKNRHVIFFMLLGLMINSYTLGFKGLSIGMVGLIIPLLIGYPLFLCGFIPAGDIKMFMVLGSINGVDSTGYIAIITLLIGGINSIRLLFKKKSFSAFYNVYKYLKLMMMTRKLSAYDTRKSIKFPLAPVTLISYLVFIFLFNML